MRYRTLRGQTMLRLLGIAWCWGSCLALLPDCAAEIWQAMEPGVYRTKRMPYSYALCDDGQCVLIGASSQTDPRPEMLPPGAENCALVLLTHHHRDSSAAAGTFLEAGVVVRAPVESQPYLSVAGVEKYWDVSLPQAMPGVFPPLFHRFWADWTYLTHPHGVEGIDFNLAEGVVIDGGVWQLQTLETPGHSQDHIAIIASRSSDNRVIAFCGDAIAAPGKIWSPYTMEWHHQQDTGMLAAAFSLRKLGHARPQTLYPEHGEPIRERVLKALEETSLRLQKAAELKSFEHYTKHIVGDSPGYCFLAEVQVGAANPQGNPLPWTKLSPHLFLTGNTYAIASRQGAVLLLDPYARNLVDRVRELRQEHGLGPVEVALISHAHNDHYTGVFALPRRDSFEVWTLSAIAEVIDHPWRFRAPYVDPRAPGVDRKLRDGEVVKWRDYELKIHHHPGQTDYAMGVEVEIDGKRCLFTGDNFYHMDQYTGSGGWSGRNNGLPDGYAATARKILELKPEWILAEHGGAFEFNEEDFRRRVRWAQAAAQIADDLSPHGRHTIDWDPQRVRVEPVVVRAKVGEPIPVAIVVRNDSDLPQTYTIRPVSPVFELEPRQVELTVPARSAARKEFAWQTWAKIARGRYVIPCEVYHQSGEADPADVFLVLEVVP